MGVPEHEIAVVTPYQAQVSLISEMIHEDHPTMTIGSVDGLQGQEREVGPRPSEPDEQVSHADTLIGSNLELGAE